MEVCRKSIYDMKTHSMMPGLLQPGSGITFTLNNQLSQLQNPLGATAAAAAAAASGDMSQYLQYHLQVRESECCRGGLRDSVVEGERECVL